VSIGDRVAGWWSAWKYVAILAVLLGLSVWGNLEQWKRAGSAAARADAAGLRQALEDSEQIRADNDASAKRLRDAADKAAERMAGAGKAYADAMRDRPLNDPQCAPGSARVDAVNQALGSADTK
jgi:hypothetical protein